MSLPTLARSTTRYVVALCAVSVLLSGFGPIASAAPQSMIQEVGFPTEDQALALWIWERFLKVPTGLGLRNIPGGERKEVYQLVDDTQAAALHHVQTFKESPYRAKTICALTYLMVINQARWLKAYIENEIKPKRRVLQEDYRNGIRKYNEPIQAYLHEALRLKPEAPVRYRLLQTLGLSYGNTRDANDAVDAFEKALLVLPTAPDLSHTFYNLCENLEKAARHRECVIKCEELLKRWPKSEYAPHVIFLMHQAYRHGGLLEEGLAHWEKYTPLLKLGAEGKPLGSFVPDDPKWTPPEIKRGNWQTYYNRNLFARGFFSWALGRKDDAIRYLQGFVDYVAERRKQGKLKDISIGAFLEHQTIPYLHTLYGFVGKPAPSIFDQEQGWIVPPNLADRAGPPRSCILWFCPLGNERYRLLYPLLNQLAAEYRDRGVQLVWISFPGSSRPEDLANEIDRFLTEAGIRQLDCSLVLDVPTATSSPLHERYGARRGSGDLFLVDANGHVQWRVIDPMYWDEGLLRRVMSRVFPKQAQ